MCLITRSRKLQWECKVSWRLPGGCAHGGILTRGDNLLWEILGRGRRQNVCYSTAKPAHRHHHALFSPVPQCRHPLHDPVLVPLRNRGGIVRIIAMLLLKGTKEMLVWREGAVNVQNTMNLLVFISVHYSVKHSPPKQCYVLIFREVRFLYDTLKDWSAYFIRTHDYYRAYATKICLYTFILQTTRFFSYHLNGH